MTVDTLGLILSVFVTAASQTEREAVRARRVSRRKKRNKTGGKVVLQRLKEKGKRAARIHTIWAARFGGKLPPKSCLVDGGFTGDSFMRRVMGCLSLGCSSGLATSRTQRICTAPKTLGGGTHFWLAILVPSIKQRS